MATLYGKSGGGNWSAAGTWSNTGSGGGDSSGPPTAADDCILESGTGNITIDSGAARYCRSLDCQGGTGDYAGTLTHNASTTLTIGDGTAGIGNRALRLSSEMTYTLGNTVDCEFLFVSTSATQQTITTAGKTLGKTTFNATSNGSWVLSDSFTANGSVSTQFTVTKGSFDSGSQSMTIGIFSTGGSSVRSITLGSSTVTITGSVSLTSATNLTFSASSSTLVVSGGGASFTGSGVTFGTVNITGSGIPFIFDSNTFGTLTRTGTAAKTDGFQLNANQTVTGTCTLTGNSKTNRLLVTSNTLGTARTLSAGTFSINGCDLRDITKAGAGSGDLSGASNYSGDCGGNTGWTFTTAAPQTATMSTNKSVSDASIWTSRVPLPQDDVSCAGITGGTLTHDMPRAGKSWNWTGATGNPAWAKTTATTIYGSLTMISGMTNSGTTNFVFEGRGSFTLTSSGQTFTSFVILQAVGGTLTQQDAWSQSNTFSHLQGTFDQNNFNRTVTLASFGGTLPATLTLGSGTLTCTGTGAVVNATNSSLTVTASTGTIAITDTSASAKTFAGNGKTWPILSIATGGAGTVTLTGANTFTRIVATGGSTKSIVLPGSTTTTLTGTTPFPSGAASNLLTFTASAGSATVSFSNQASCDYVSLTNIIAAGTTPAYAGTHSTDGGGNTNWQFTAPPSGPGFLLRRNQLSGGMSGMGL